MTPPSRRALLSGLAATTVAGLAGCSWLDRVRGPNERPPDSVGTAQTPSLVTWRVPTGDSHNTARSRLPAVGRPAPAWHVDPSETDRERALVAAVEGFVVVATERDDELVLRARDATDGTVRWQRQFGRGGVAEGLLAETLFVIVGGADVLALDATDGTTRWCVPLHDRLSEAVPERFLVSEPSDLDAHLRATPETVYVQSSYGLHGLDPKNETERWRLYLGSDGGFNDRHLRYSSGLAVGTETIWASYSHPTRRLFEIDVVRDELRTESTPLRTEYATSPVVTKAGRGARAAVGQWVGSTRAVTPVVGGYGSTDDRWSFPGLDAADGPSYIAPPATDGSRLFVPQVRPVGQGMEFALLALDADTGALAWTHREPVGEFPSGADFFDRFTLAAPAVAGGSVLAGYAADPTDGRQSRVLLALATGSGTERWRVDPDVVPSRVAVAGDRLYVAGDAGGFAALARSE